MRVGKKLNVVETKRTRSCVVRLEKVRTPFNNGKTTKKSGENVANRSSSGSIKTSPASSIAQDTKKITGPLKKRPMSQTLITTSATPLARATAILKAAAAQKAAAAAIKAVTTLRVGAIPKTTLKPTATPRPVVIARPAAIPRPITAPRPATTPRPFTTPKPSAPPKNIMITNKERTTSFNIARPSPSATPPVEEEATPTIAAGRSRRAIKPNPKYASADMITPKMIKNVGTLSSSSSLFSTAKDGKKQAVAGSTSSASTAADKKRKLSSSSSEDFYNKDSSDADYGAKHDGKDKPYQLLDDSDSDFSDLDLPPRFFKSRAREIKTANIITATAGKSARPNITPVSVTAKISTLKTINTPTLKSTNTPTAVKAAIASGLGKTQLSQLRRSIFTTNASANRSIAAASMQSAVANKRKLNESSNDSDSDNFAVKRKRLSNSNKDASVAASLSSQQSSYALNHKTLMSRKSLSNSQTMNGSKVVYGSTASKMSNTALLLEKRKALLEKSMRSTTPPLKATPPTKHTTQNLIAKPLSITTGNKPALKQAVLRQRTSSPAAPKVASKIKENDKLETSPSATIDDFETMPTFTIVNINDIINKKGDVLISKANALTKSVSSKAQSKKIDDDVNEISEEDEEDNTTKGDRAKKSGIKQNRRKNVHTTLPSDKIQTASASKTPPPQRTITAPSKSNISSPTGSAATNIPVKKPGQTILNHALTSKNANNTNQRQTRASNVKALSNKPAPRILNSMVAKKTLPIKPLIANMDDSADESYPLSLEDELDDIDDEEEDLDMLSPNTISKGRTFIGSKKPPPGTKENSLAATNRLPTHTNAVKTSTTLPSLPQRKLSPEKVVISRQGDKIIKKITCFETWYIINLPEDRPAEVVRNQLDIPLIKLANSSKLVELPTSSWNSKVTLYHLNSSALMNSNYTTYTGDISEQNIPEEDRGKYQPSCVMFRRSVSDRTKSRLPYDRAVIFKNKTFFTNIDGKNVKLIGAPFKISSLTEVEILLQLVDELTLQSPFVEQTTTVQ